MRLRKQVSQNIVRLRTEGNLSKLQLAKRAKLDPSQVTKIESGEQNLTLDVIERLAKALGVSPALLLGGKAGGIEIGNTDKDSLDIALGMLKKSLSLLESIKK
jgi:transcriptional regulator with XRE-family HTH domain